MTMSTAKMVTTSEEGNCNMQPSEPDGKYIPPHLRDDYKGSGALPPNATDSSSSGEGNALIVRKLHIFLSQHEVKKKFWEYKSITSIKLKSKRQNVRVTMSDPNDCERAISQFKEDPFFYVVPYKEDTSSRSRHGSGGFTSSSAESSGNDLFVRRSLPLDSAEVEELFSTYKTDSIDVENTEALVMMSDPKDCDDAISNLHCKSGGTVYDVQQNQSSRSRHNSRKHVPKVGGDGEFLDIDLDDLARETYNPKTAKEPGVLGCYSVQADDPLDSKTAAEKYTLQSYSISDTSNLMDLNLTKCNAENGESDLSVYDEWVDIQPLDLTVGYEDRNRTKHQSKQLLFKFVERENLCDNLGTFVCSRRHLIPIAMSPYNSSERYDVGNTIVVQKIGSVFFMSSEEIKASSKKKAEEKIELQKKQSFWGLNFETYVTAKPGESPDPGRRVDYDCHFCSVVTRNIGQHSVTVKGEVDCCLPRDRQHYLELKTVNRNGDEDILEQAKLKWWLQSYLLGVKDILCGHIDKQNKDGEGRVTKLKRFEVVKLESSLEEEAERRPRVCMNFLERFLTFVKDNVKKDFLPYVFERGNGEKRFHMKPEDSENLEEYKFLPASFVNFYQKK